MWDSLIRVHQQTRASTVAQALEQQDAALAAAGITKTLSDTMSGVRDDRPVLAALLDYVRDGDSRVTIHLRAKRSPSKCLFEELGLGS
ncbi:MAG TPA: recombinase family protein [Mycobacterium sp.]|nr:recombinase family protein [Mycobacterium sp.]